MGVLFNLRSDGQHILVSDTIMAVFLLLFYWVHVTTQIIIGYEETIIIILFIALSHQYPITDLVEGQSD
jgi:hypothetical protein